MDGVQFGTYVFPHNPASITIERQEITHQYLLPTVGERSHKVGQGLRHVLCQGALYSDNYATTQKMWQELLSACFRKDFQLLFLPHHSPFSACLKKYSCAAQQDGLLLPYTLLFVEEGKDE